MDAPDPIFSARNLFYLGGYREAIDDASTLAGLTEEQEAERDYFVYRSYIELGDTEARRGAPPSRGDLRRRRWASIAPRRGRPRGRGGEGRGEPSAPRVAPIATRRADPFFRRRTCRPRRPTSRARRASVRRGRADRGAG